MKMMALESSLDLSSLHPVDRGFVHQFLALGIEEGTRLVSTTETVREVVAVHCNAVGVPVTMETRVLSGSPGHHKTCYTIREVAIGFQKCLVRKQVQRVLSWED